jgi:hypothetical protein
MKTETKIKERTCENCRFLEKKRAAIEVFENGKKQPPIFIWVCYDKWFSRKPKNKTFLCEKHEFKDLPLGNTVGKLKQLKKND